MNPEKLHDALNLLEDDLIIPVERLREKKRTFRWRHFGALAACLAVVCALGLYGLGLFDRAKTNDTAPEEAGLQVENITDSEAGDEEIVDQAQTGIAAEVPSVLVRIDKWEENGFAGTVWETVDTDIYPVGTAVTVRFEKNIQLAVTDDSTTRYSHLTPGARPFAEGTVVRVSFRTAETPESMSPGKEITRTILYAEQIAPAE